MKTKPKTAKETPIGPMRIGMRRKFTDEQVWAFRARVRAGETITSIAKETRTSYMCMWNAIRGKGPYAGG